MNPLAGPALELTTSESDGVSADHSNGPRDTEPVSDAASGNGELELMSTGESLGDDTHQESPPSSRELTSPLGQLLGVKWPAEPERQGSLMDGSSFEQHCERRQRPLLAFQDVTLNHLQRLGFLVNWTKSCLTPTKSIPYLWLELDSVSMMVRLSQVHQTDLNE